MEGELLSEFTVKDSGARREFDSGMVRDTAEGKINFLLILPGPMKRRWAAHLTKAEAKYPPIAPGVANWTQADGPEELLRARESAARHFESWLNGERDEDHAAALFFNVNLVEYVEEKMAAEKPKTSKALRGLDYDENCMLCKQIRYHTEHTVPPTPVFFTKEDFTKSGAHVPEFGLAQSGQIVKLGPPNDASPDG